MHRPHVVLLKADKGPLPYNMEAITGIAEVTVTTGSDLERALPGADVLLLWDFFSSALKSAWPSAHRLEWIHVAAAGVDSLMFEELRESSVVVTNAHGVFDQPIAEFVLASILAHDKQLHLSRQLQRERLWRHRELTLTAGSRAMIVGTGGIGRAIARLLSAVGLQVRGVGRRPREHDRDFGAIVSSSDLAANVGWADHLVVVAPLTPQTRGLINAEVLAAMKPEAHLINVGRGALIDEQSLVSALTEKRISHASLDVFLEEPLPADHSLWVLDNVSISAHMSGDVLGWRHTLADQFLDNLHSFTAGQRFPIHVDKCKGYAVGSGPGTRQQSEP